jgi:hypothetical protein
MPKDPHRVTEHRWLRWSIAFVWLATGLGVLHPYYREVGTAYLARLHLPPWVMILTCIAEVLLGLRVALGTAATWITLLQIVVIGGFTMILAFLDPWLLVHHLGLLAKNIPLMAVIGTAWLLEREGWSGRAHWLLCSGLAVIWIIEGLFPKILFQNPEQLTLVAESGLVPGDPADFLRFLGGCQVACGVAVLLTHGWLFRWLLIAQLAALIALPLLITFEQPLWWFHPFGPFTKNVPIIAGTWALWRSRGRWRLAGSGQLGKNI